VHFRQEFADQVAGKVMKLGALIDPVIERYGA
jgi:hypothetical protein